MLSVLKQIFESTEADSGTNENATDELQMAAAILFLEAMHADHVVSAEEEQALEQALMRLFGIQAEQARAIRTSAEQHFENMTSMHVFVATINQNFTTSQKVQVVEGMWRIAHSDQVLDKYEEHIIRRIAGLLHVSHADFMQAKHRSVSK